MTIERKCIRFNIKAEGSNKGEISGYGSVFGNIDHGGDIIQKGAFVNSLKQLAESGAMPAMLWSHNTMSPIGDWATMSEDEHGLQVDGSLWVEGNSVGATPVPDAAKAHNMARGTGPKGLSIGYIVKDASFEERNGERIRIIKEVELVEVSLVVFAMNEAASVTSVKNLDINNIRSVEKMLTAAGFSNTQAKALLSDGFKGLTRDDSTEQRDAEIDEIKQLLNAETSTLKKGNYSNE